MTIGKFGKNFISRSSELIHTPRLRTPATQVFRSIENSFTNHPFSTHFSKSAQFPFSSNLSTFKPPFLTPTRNFSTSSKEAKTPPSPSLIEESLRKVSEEKNPTKIREIIQSLPLNLRKELALALVKKTPEIVFDNIQVFEIEDEKTRIELFSSAFNSETCTEIREMVLLPKFKNFNIKDRDFLVKVAPTFLDYLITLESTFKMLNITDPETLERAVLHISEKNQYFWLGVEGKFLSIILRDLNITKPDIIEKIIFNISENIEVHFLKKSERDIDHCLGDLVKDLPNLTSNIELCEKIALKIAEKKPKELIGHLKPLLLSESVLKEIIPKIIQNIRNSSDLSILIQELPMIGIEDQSFIENIILITADKFPTSLLGKLHTLHLSKEFLKEIIPKIIQNKNKFSDLTMLIQELPMIGIEDQSFIEKIIIIMADKFPESLVGKLHTLHLSKEFLKTIIPLIATNIRFTALRRQLIKELPALLPEDPTFIEKMTLDVLEKNRYALIQNLQPLNLKEEVVKQIISKLVESYISELDADIMLSAGATHQFIHKS